MNEKAFTLVELIAVVVIMAIIMVIATPNIVNMLDKGKKEDYIADAKNFISKATYEYRKDEKGLCDENSNESNECSIFLKQLQISDEDKIDPYGLEYDFAKSKVVFSTAASEDNEGDEDKLPVRQVRITLVSHNETNCYTIEDIQKTDLNKDSVKKGNYSNDACTTSD